MAGYNTVRALDHPSVYTPQTEGDGSAALLSVLALTLASYFVSLPPKIQFCMYMAGKS